MRNSKTTSTKIRRFMRPQLWEGSAKITYSLDTNATQSTIARQKVEETERTEIIIHKKNRYRAADQTAYLQAVLNSKREHQPKRIPTQTRRDTVGTTAHIQALIDYRRQTEKK